MSDIIVLFQYAVPLLFLFVLVVGAVMGVTLALRHSGSLISRRPRVVTVARHRKLVERKSPKRM